MSTDQMYQDFAAQAQQTLGTNLRSLLLYGSAVKQPATQHASVQYLFLLERVDRPTLEALQNLIQAHPSPEIKPFVMTAAELQRSADVFPVKFLDISRHHQCLVGDDPFQSLEIHREHLRLRAEQELTSLAMHLRYEFLTDGGFFGSVERIMRRGLRTLLNNLTVLIELKTGEVITDDASLFARGGSNLGLPHAPVLTDLQAWYSGQKEHTEEELMALYERYLQLVDELAALADTTEA